MRILKPIIYISLVFQLIIACKREPKEFTEEDLKNLPKVTKDTTFTDKDGRVWDIHVNALRKPSVIVLPPFDEIANEGISPDVQKYLENELAQDTTVTLLKFPYKELMNVPYHNVFDKKYCKPIIDIVDPDVIIMTKLDQKLRTGQMGSDKWSLSIRILHTRQDIQLDSKVTADNLSGAEIAELLEANRQILSAEIKNTH